MSLAALLWDVDGTLAETERDGHRVAFNRAFEALGLPWRWSVEHYGALLGVTGGRERLLHDLALRPDAPASATEREALARRLHRHKNAVYADIVAAGAIALRPGVAALIDEAAAAGVRQAITTTTSRANVDALLHAALGPGGARRFAAVVCGEDVQRKKPDPEVFTRALRQLGLAPREALAIEDSPPGVAAARAAGVAVVVTRSAYFAHGAVDGALAVGPGLDRREGWQPPPRAAAAAPRLTLADLADWHGSACVAAAR